MFKRFIDLFDISTIMLFDEFYWELSCDTSREQFLNFVHIDDSISDL